jgi:hypothetical protein
MIRPLFALALVSAVLLDPSGAAADEELPLPRGFYVRTDAACAAASEATLVLLQRDGLGGGQDFCAFERITPESAQSFRVAERCADFRDPAAAERREVAYAILAAGRFRRSDASGWSAEYQHCPQASLPEPWRSNDISDVLR